MFDNSEIKLYLGEAISHLDSASHCIENAETAIYRQTGDFTKTVESVLMEVWGLKCKVNVLLQDWSMR